MSWILDTRFWILDASQQIRQRFRKRREIGLPEGGAGVVEADGEDSFRRLIRDRLAEFEIRLGKDEVVEKISDFGMSTTSSTRLWAHPFAVWQSKTILGAFWARKVGF